MQLKGIEYFITIAETGSFTAAADKLFISQPALSQQVRKLEDEIGVKLFDRSKHSATLTPAGELFLQEGKRILQIYDQLLQRMFLLEHPAEEVVRFGISPFYSRHYLPLLLPPLVKACPTLRYEVTENYSYLIEKALIEGTLDFCLVPLLPQNERLSYEPVYQETILLAVPRDSPVNRFSMTVGGIRCMDLRNVKDEPFVALKSVQKFSEYSFQLCQQAGFTPNIVCETMNWDALNRLVSTGMGVGFVPDILEDQLDEGIRPQYYRLLPPAQRIYTIAYRKGDELSDAARRMVDVFRRVFSARQRNRRTA